MTKYTAMYFIKKFSEIPEHEWTMGNWHDAGKSCALGHCGETAHSSNTKESLAFRRLLEKIGDTCGYEVNDAFLKDDFYELGTHPKERVLNALLLINAGVDLR